MDGPAPVFVDAPLFESADWSAVYLDQNRKHWCRLTDGQLLPVSRDAAGNWTTTRGEVLIFTPEGTIFRPADDPIILPDLDIEREVLVIAAARLRDGRPLGIEDDARVGLARRRVELWRQLEDAA
ncbi:hypothetical protein [uncultured Thiodictyon sp.]|jgi:hypothetical protein|uniref:hypothetical protein n=1 Tax=uncultured Thiodictyon sp. TaxID=1846217 RepID=UPI0025E9B420|nr:hypothetical protein [uncultured Thiodictyon sp.]